MCWKCSYESADVVIIHGLNLNFFFSEYKILRMQFVFN